MTYNFNIISLVFGFLGCFGIIVSFMAQLKSIYNSMDASGTSWGLIVLQIIASCCLGISSGINTYFDGISNLPFLVTNLVVILLFIIMCYMKCTFPTP